MSAVRFSGSDKADASASQGRAKSTAAQPRTLDAPQPSVGQNKARRNQAIDFAHLKRNISLEMVLSRYGILDQLKRAGSQLAGCCPIHNGSNPKQFLVNLRNNTWHCFSPECNRGGGLIEFVALRENVGIKRAAELIAEWFALPSSPWPRRPHQQRKKSMNTRPSHRAYVVEDADGDQTGQKGFWTRCGSAWIHKDGKGLNVQIVPGLAVSGRLVLREYTADDEAADAAKKVKRGK